MQLESSKVEQKRELDDLLCNQQRNDEDLINKIRQGERIIQLNNPDVPFGPPDHVSRVSDEHIVVFTYSTVISLLASKLPPFLRNPQHKKQASNAPNTTRVRAIVLTSAAHSNEC